LLRDGGIVAAGPIAEVMTPQNLSTTFGVDLMVTRSKGRFAARALRYNIGTATSGSDIMGWLWWVGLTLALGVIEMLTVGLMFLMLGGGALAGAIVGALGAPLWAQVLVAVAVAGLLLFIVRPLAKRRLEAHTPKAATGAAAHVGRTATVVADEIGRASCREGV